MHEKLIIYLERQALENPSWVLLDAANTVQETVVKGESALLQAKSQGRQVIVVVPAEDVVLTRVSLPKMSHAKLMQALPFALEENLTEDIDQLHFALANQQHEGFYSVAIVARKKMRQWLDLFSSWHLQIDALIPESLSLPYEENAWYICMHDGMVVVRTDLLQGFACDITNLNEFLTLALKESEHAPNHIYIHNDSSTPFANTMEIPAEVHEEFFNAAQHIAYLAAMPSVTLNLLQGNYAVKKSHFPRTTKLLKVASALGCLFIFLLFAYPIGTYFIYNTRVLALDHQIAAIYKRHFPNAASVVAPKLRMQDKLKKMSEKSGEHRLLILLGYIAKAMVEVPADINLKRFDYQNDQLTLELTAASSEAFSVFTDSLQRRNLSVKQQNANLSGSKINATLLIE